MNSSALISRFLYKIYSINNERLRWKIFHLVELIEGGQFYSITLRKIMKDFHDVNIGMYSYGGCFDRNSIPPGTEIGRYGSFASFKIFQRNHPQNFISTHPFFFNTSLGYINNEIIDLSKLSIGHDVWIGHNALILPGVNSIGNGSIIGASSVITKDVQPYSVVAGNPAKIIKFRFPSKVIGEIEKSKWWDLSIEEISRDIEKFINPVIQS